MLDKSGGFLRQLLLLAALGTYVTPAPAQTEPPPDVSETGGTIETPDTAAESASIPAADPATSPAMAAGRFSQPGRGQVTNLPIPRFVMLKSNEGNARRGPGLSHRIDWVFKRAGMPLRVTAEYENWRRVEDLEGFGGWMHYSMLSGARSAIVIAELADLRAAPSPDADVLLRAESGVIGRIQQCIPDWCRLSIDGERAWISKAAIWGVEPGEIIE